MEGYDSLFAGPVEAESLNGTTSLKPKPSIYYYGFDTLNYRDGDHSAGGHRIKWSTSISSTHFSILTTVLSRSYGNYSFRVCYNGGLFLAFLSYDIIWSMEVMRHDDITSFYHGITCREKDLGELLCAVEKTTCAVYLDLWLEGSWWAPLGRWRR